MMKTFGVGSMPKLAPPLRRFDLTVSIARIGEEH